MLSPAEQLSGANLFDVVNVEWREELLETNAPPFAESAKPILQRPYHPVGSLRGRFIWARGRHRRLA